MSEVIVTDNGDENVLAEAAVASTAMAGAALAQSAAVAEDLNNTEQIANDAAALSVEAHHELDNKPSFDEVSDMVETSVNDAFNRLANILSERLAPAAKSVSEAPVVVEEVPEEVAPRSVEKATKTKRTFRDRYLGLE
jgi:hypothetical protein